MRKLPPSGAPRAAFSFLTCAALFSVTPFPAIQVQAQTFSELQNITFYPEPLATDLAVAASSPAAEVCNCDAASGADVERIDMAMFEEAATSSYLQDISAIEANAGSYARELTQQLTSAGLLYQQQNLHEDAVLTLERAAESSRIHDGLYSTEQIALAEHSINSLVALGRFDEVEARYSQLLDIHRNLHGPRAAQTAHALLRFGQWQVERLHVDLASAEIGARQSASDTTDVLDGYEAYDRRFEVLYRAQAHFVDALGILIENAAWTDPAIFALERNLIRTYYMDAYRARVIDNPLSYAADAESSHARRRSMAERSPVPEQYYKGEQAYRRMFGYLHKNPDASFAEVADVSLGLADWQLLFGKHAEARELYRQLEALVAQAGTAPAEAAAILHPAMPATLPVFHESALSPKPAADMAVVKGHVDVRFNLSRHGHATNLEVVGTSEGTDDAVIERLQKLVRNAQFRPATEAGAEYRLRYYFSY